MICVSRAMLFTTALSSRSLSARVYSKQKAMNEEEEEEEDA